MPESLTADLTEMNWALVKTMDQLGPFSGLVSNMESDALQWKRWLSEAQAEIVDMPRQFKELELFHRMLLLRALRPDRLTSALSLFVAEQMGDRYVEHLPFSMNDTYEETSNRIPIFFVLFPGYDPTVDVEKQGHTFDITIANGRFDNISMG